MREMRRRLMVAAALAVVAAELYRDGFIAPLVYGARRWSEARPDRFIEADPLG